MSVDESWPISGRTKIEVDVDSTMLDMEVTFCCQGDMLCCGGDCDSAMAARCCVAWGKYLNLKWIWMDGKHLPSVFFPWISFTENQEVAQSLFRLQLVGSLDLPQDLLCHNGHYRGLWVGGGGFQPAWDYPEDWCWLKLVQRLNSPLIDTAGLFRKFCKQITVHQ